VPPLVTLAIFAYNQENCISEAVLAALEQTYSPLQIIISDDFSSDATFDVIRRTVAAYTGPHEIVVRRSEVNLGTALHLTAVARASAGELLVVGAGDDISEPYRCERIVAAWLSNGKTARCIHSGATAFGGLNGAEFYLAPKSRNLTKDDCERLILADRLPFLSPTCAYAKELFSEYDPLLGGSIIEDGVMALRSLASGNVVSISESLVRIRRAPETGGTGYKIAQPERWNRFILSRMVSYATMLRDIHRTSLDSAVRKRASSIYARKITLLSRFVLPAERGLNAIQKLIFFLKFIFLYPSSATTTAKIGDALMITGILTQQNLQRLRPRRSKD